MITSLLTLLVTLAVSGEGRNLQQNFSKQPESVRILEGGNVTLECGVRNKVGVLQWTKDDFGLGTSRSLPGYSRMSMVGDNNQTWNLELVRVSLEEDGRYQCQVGATDTSPPIRSEYAVLTVLSRPEPPVLTVGPVMRVEEGTEALVQCLSRGGHPASVIRWRLNGQLVTAGIEEKVTKMEGSKKLLTVSTLKFPVTINLTGAELVCEAENEATAAAETVRTEIDVEFKPKVRLSWDKKVEEGERVKFSCQAEAAPAEVSYQWFLDSQELEEAAGVLELVMDLSRDLNNKRVSCLVRNKLGQSSAEQILTVEYGPSFVEDYPEEITGYSGDRVILQCQVDSNPAAEYVWLRNGDAFEIVGTGSVLSFSLSAATAGSYTCQATVTGHSPLRRTTQVSVLAAPVILNSDLAQFGTVGDTVHVHCETESLPQVKQFTWKFNGEKITKDSPVISIVESRHGNNVKSTIVIKNAKKDHFGHYECGVENEMGLTEATIELRELEPLPLLIILSATISGLLLTVVVMVIVMTCKKVASKSDRPDISVWPGARAQSSSYSDSSSEEPSQSNITSSLTVDDPDDSFESLPVNYSAFIKSENIPDHVYPQSPGHAKHSYIVYNHYATDHDMMAGNSYANPYVQSTSPMTVSSGENNNRNASPVYTNMSPYKSRDEAVIKYLEGEVSAEQLDHLKLGTHV